MNLMVAVHRATALHTSQSTTFKTNGSSVYVLVVGESKSGVSLTPEGEGQGHSKFLFIKKVT